ncbi:SixA phosphatase family protein [Streptomyces bambusae]|uniref:Histidine phosphatase family protein n=1 Tax=Streptomyces bambusae TaxID=1550616 RepID=A0ABS6Z8W3_9ACTN|nr:histidine phosphatase family protein [Streptomyces bambusae]MBW5484200.1 histidine phosphatase family protein [Streptomyces bambusae]
MPDLVILRHAKSAWPPGVPDRDRPLGPRGLRDAPAAGRLLAQSGPLPDLVLCSPARRTRETWELAARELPAEPPVRFEPRLYAADAEDILDTVREVPAGVGTLLLVGHNPGLQDLVLLLAGTARGGAGGDALDRLATKFPTSAVAVLAAPGTWADLTPGGAALTAFEIPRGGR